MSSERETDRLEIIELTQTLSQERRKRDLEKQLIDELKQQVSSNVISVVEFQRWWVKTSKIFGQKSIYSQETIVF